MLVVVNKPSYVFHKIYGIDQGNTNSLMFIPPLTCFGEKTVDLIPASTDIGSTTYGSTELSVLAVTSAGAPTVTQNGVTVLPYTTNGGGSVTGNTYRTSYRYKLTGPNTKVKVSSTEAIQAELFGASGDAGFGGYYSGFGEPPTYSIAISSPYGFLCPGTGTISIVTLGGTGNTYQWYRNNALIPGATAATYTLNGYTHWKEGLMMSVGVAFGAYIGATYASKAAAKIIRPSLIFIVVLLMVKLIWFS